MTACQLAMFGPQVGKYQRKPAPQCKEPDCENEALSLRDGGHLEHCYEHATAEERERYMSAWGLPRWPYKVAEGR